VLRREEIYLNIESFIFDEVMVNKIDMSFGGELSQIKVGASPVFRALFLELTLN